jgi:hypothetical protein
VREQVVEPIRASGVPADRRAVCVYYCRDKVVCVVQSYCMGVRGLNTRWCREASVIAHGSQAVRPGGERRMAERAHSIAGVGPVRAADLQWSGKDTDAIASLRAEHAKALEELKAAKEQLNKYRDEITANEDIIHKLGLEVMFFAAVSSLPSSQSVSLCRFLTCLTRPACACPWPLLGSLEAPPHTSLLYTY